MEQDSINKAGPDKKRHRSRFLQIAGFAALFVVTIALLAGFWVKFNLYASEFRPTKLSKKEQQVLDSKLALLDDSSKRERAIRKKEHDISKDRLTPERYTEEGASREINLSEREFNALIANTPEIARRVAIDLSENLVSLKLVVPIDEDIGIVGGKTLRLNLGVILSYEEDHPVVALKGISIGGIPMPNAWLGYMKNENLFDEFGTDGGFWDLFAEGIDDIKVKDGYLMIRLKE